MGMTQSWGHGLMMLFQVVENGLGVFGWVEMGELMVFTQRVTEKALL